MNTCILSDSTKSIKGKLGGSAATNPVFTSHYYDSLQSNIAEDFNDGAFNGTTSVDLVPAPSSGHRRIVKEITIYNGDSNDQTVELVIDNNGAETVIWKQVVKAGSVAYVFQPDVVAAGGMEEHDNEMHSTNYEPELNTDQKRKITYGTADPSGGSDGDVYMQYE